jgi:hypothetical protein
MRSRTQSSPTLSARPRNSPSPSPYAIRHNDRPLYAEALPHRKQLVLSWLAWRFGWVLIAAAIASSAQAQTSVTLGWDASPDSAVVGYRLYYGSACRDYTNMIDVGSATTATVSNLDWGETYYFAVTAYDTNGLESAFSGEISFAVPFPTNTALTFAADSGTFKTPFIDSNGTLSQCVMTGVTNGGRAVYTFNITNAGTYVVNAMVIAPSLSQNTFCVNIDAEPTDPLMIWDIPVSPTLTPRTVSWRGNGNGYPASDQYSPKVFSLAVGSHQLIIRGEDANATLGTISIVPAPPTLSISLETASYGTSHGTAKTSQPTVVLTVTGQAGQTCTVLCSQDLKTWNSIGTVKLDSRGSAQFTDPASTSQPNRVYRVQSITLLSPRLQIRVVAGGQIILSGTGPSGQSYKVLSSPDFKTWTLIGKMTLDSTGSGVFTDPAGNSRPECFYRLQE